MKFEIQSEPPVSFDREFAEEFFCYRGHAKEIACPKAKRKRFSLTSDPKKLTCPDCLDNWNKNKKDILLKYAIPQHGTYSWYVFLECRCEICVLYWKRRQASLKIKKGLISDYGKSEKEVMDFLFSRVNDTDETLYVDILINDPARFRALATSFFL